MYRWKAYNYLDIRANFLKMGYEVDEMKQKLESYDMDEAFAEKMKQQLLSKTYDFVFTVNYFGLISDVCETLGILYVSWTCDNPLISMYHNSVFHSCNQIFTFDESNYREFKAMGVEHIHYLPLAVDAKRMETMIASADDLKLYQNEISFVGSLYERNSYDKLESVLPDYLRGYFEAMMCIQSDLYGSSMINEALTPSILQQLQQYYHLDKKEDSFSDLGLIFETTTLGFKIAQLQRKENLMALSKILPVSLYSNSDASDLLLVQYKGSLDYWTQLPKVFYASKINLNFTIPNIKSGIPLRMWDVLGAGGFLLTNYQVETSQYFTEGEDLVSFYSKADLLEKAKFYYEHDEIRKRIAVNGHEKVKKYHSYEARMLEMMKILKI